MQIKIRELPDISHKQVSDIDYMVIENTKDTFKIPISDLKVLFSCDNKLDALSKDLNEKINRSIETTNEIYQEYLKDIEDIKNTINLFNNSLDNFSKRISLSEKNIENIDKSIENINDELESATLKFKELYEFKNDALLKLNSLDNLTSEQSKEISSLKDTANAHEETLLIIKKKIEEIENTITNMSSQINDKVNNVDSRLDDKINRIHNEILELIDSYHHETH